MSVFYKVNNVDLLPFLVDGGLEWEENDIDAENSGRSLDGQMHRSVVARKDKHILTFRKLKLDEIRTVTNAVRTQYVSVETNIHPRLSGSVSFTMYNSARKGAVFTLADDGTAEWQLDSLSLIER